MPRRGECIYKRKDGRWEARYVKEIGLDGRKKYGSVYANSYRAAKEKQLYYKVKLAEPISDNANIKISSLMECWLCHLKQRVKLSTWNKYEIMVRNHILPCMGEFTLQQIDRAYIDKFAETLLQNGRVGGGGLSRKTVNDILIILGLAFEFAQEEYCIQLPRIHYLKEGKKESRVLSIQEQERLVSYLICDMDEFKFCVLLTLYTGLRIGELCALRWENIHDGYLYIEQTMQRLKSEGGKTAIVLGEPKSESSKRMIPLPNFLIPYVNRFRQTQEYVLRTNRSVHSEPRNVQYRFRTITDALGLENVTFHTLRHTFATRCIEAGFDVKSLSEILGHADVKTTLNRYVHSSFAFKQENMNKLVLTTNNQ